MFYILKDNSFYDPHGFYFDHEGLDAAGGSYDNEGYYISPAQYIEGELEESDYGEDHDD